ncbi:cysteine-rich secretory protein lccl domain-containing 2 [Plakobranchus ocellatus]|uniref:Cysteine-rich secretory protein lccl domain-containing 2 n=1 Tax=Plakobranchus ocellatus TaxID=259542 RepID=A0AAV3YG11_9GAST|nr:cysteine-rich secretory protein lccl domain-containing 2 [Plakobranchus ocellatus]
MLTTPQRWDKYLAEQAAQWSERCLYERPRISDRYGTVINSNLYVVPGNVYGPKAVKKMVTSALSMWGRARNGYTYSTHCGRSCSYVQMIQARVDRIGCAISTCSNLRHRTKSYGYASILVCFYSPGQSLLSSFPFTRGSACSRCARGMECRERLCHRPGTELVPRDMLKIERGPAPLAVAQDRLSSSEIYSLNDAHNKMRRGNKINNGLAWDSYLERWSKWIINCSIDYPGPRHTYTNFERLEQGKDVYHVVYAWSIEEFNTRLRMAHGCRTPGDKERCNHFTNILQPFLTSMACAAHDCGDGTRQLVCLYDNEADRPARYRPTSGRRRSFYSPPPDEMRRSPQDTRYSGVRRERQWRRSYRERRDRG